MLEGVAGTQSISSVNRRIGGQVHLTTAHAWYAAHHVLADARGRLQHHNRLVVADGRGLLLVHLLDISGALLLHNLCVHFPPRRAILRLVRRDVYHRVGQRFVMLAFQVPGLHLRRSINEIHIRLRMVGVGGLRQPRVVNGVSDQVLLDVVDLSAESLVIASNLDLDVKTVRKDRFLRLIFRRIAILETGRRLQIDNRHSSPR